MKPIVFKPNKGLLLLAIIFVLPVMAQTSTPAANCPEGDCNCLSQAIAAAQQAAANPEKKKVETAHEGISQKSKDFKSLCLDQAASINLSGFGQYSPIVTAAISRLCDRAGTAANNSQTQQQFQQAQQMVPNQGAPSQVTPERSAMDKLRCLIGICN